jgi:phosphatidylinositol glycan class B
VSDRSFERWCLLGALVLILLATWYSVGFYHYDEHFQLLEFAANFKHGLQPTTDVPWEYQARIRPWFQPAVALVILDVLERVGDTNPFHAATCLRLLSGLLAWTALARLIGCSRFLFTSEPVRRYAIAASCFLWFVPFLSVRFSSESWAGALFLLGYVPLVLLARAERVSTMGLGMAGMMLGLAFASRYQVGLLIAGALAWFLWAARPTMAQWGAVGFGFLLAVGGSLLLDRWGYGQWGLTPWRYVDYQVFQAIAARRFGSAPWWAYGPRVIAAAGPPIGLLLLAGALAAWVRRPGSPLTWASLPFFAVHCLLAHKELRFLFPLAPLAPFLAAQGLEAMPSRVRHAASSAPARIAWAVLVLLNVVGLAVRTILPARQEIAVERAIYYEHATRLLIVHGKDPFTVGDLHPHFYRDPRTEVRELTGVAEGAGNGEFLKSVLSVWPASAGFDTTTLSCRIVYRSFPAWSLPEPLPVGWRWARSDPWTLAWCWARDLGGGPRPHRD